MEEDNNIKLSKYYDPLKMRKFVNHMEFFAELMQDTEASEARQKRARLLFEHYRRMVLNQAVKEIPEDFHVQDVLNMKEVIKILEDIPSTKK